MWHDSSSCHTITFASRAIAIVQSLKMTHWPWRLTRLIDLWHDALKYDMPRWNVTWLIYMLTNHLLFARNRRSKIIDMTDWWLRDSLARDMMHWNMTCFVDMWHDSSTCWLIIFSSRAIAVVKSLIWLIDVLHDLCEMMRWNVTWLIDIWPNDWYPEIDLKRSPTKETCERDLQTRPTKETCKGDLWKRLSWCVLVEGKWACCSVLHVLQCVAVSCTVLQCIAMCWSVLQFIERRLVCHYLQHAPGRLLQSRVAVSVGSVCVLQCVAVCVLQCMCVAVACCSVLQCCSALQCTAACCSVLQCDAVRWKMGTSNQKDSMRTHDSSTSNKIHAEILSEDVAGGLLSGQKSCVWGGGLVLEDVAASLRSGRKSLIEWRGRRSSVGRRCNTSCFLQEVLCL